jgi:hypothetical protein
MITGATEAEDICSTWDPSIDLDCLFDGTCKYVNISARMAVVCFALSGCMFAILIFDIAGITSDTAQQVVGSWCSLQEHICGLLNNNELL